MPTYPSPFRAKRQGLCGKGFSYDEAVAQTSRLAAATAVLLVYASSIAIAPATPAGDGHEDVDDLPSAPESAIHEVVEEPSTKLGDFVVSIQERSGFKRLHRIGDCPRMPGVDDRRCLLIGPEHPPTASYNARCKQCFQASDIHVEEGTSETATTSSSSDAKPACVYIIWSLLSGCPGNVEGAHV